MRIVLTSLGSTGDVQPMLALGLQCQRAGHDVVLACSPQYAARANGIGISFAPIGPVVASEDITRVGTAIARQTSAVDQERQFLSFVMPLMPQIYADLLAVCADADVLIAPPFQFAAHAVHSRTGIPFVSVHFSQFGDLGVRDAHDPATVLINEWRASEGLPPAIDPLGRGGNSDRLALYAISRHLLSRPSRWPDHYRVTGFFFLDEDDWQPDAALAEFLAAGPPPIAITFGSCVHENPAAVTRVLVDAVARANCRAVIQQGWSGLARDALPASCHVARYVPHAWLFDRCSLVVHHGSAGTTSSAFRAGVPSVIVPHQLDQPMWGELAREKGCALTVLPAAHLNAPRLGAAIRRTLDDRACRSAAAQFAAHIRAEGGAATARALVEQLAGRVAAAAPAGAESATAAAAFSAPLSAI